MLEYILQQLQEPSLLSVFFAYLGGVLTSLTPCIYPMIPILLGVIGASRIESRWQGLSLSVAYAMGLALVYTLLGMFAALTGSFFGRIASNPWSLLVFANLCLVLGCWMLDWVQLPLFSTARGTTRKGHIGAFITGLLSGLVAATCSSPVLAGLLIYVTNSRDVALGAVMLFAFAFGMSSLLIVIGTFSGVLKRLPDPGRWMIFVKRLLAVGLLAYGEYFLLRAGRLLL